MTGIWVTGFEASEFLPGAHSIREVPEFWTALKANALPRNDFDLEVDSARVEHLSGRKLAGGSIYEAFVVTFDGRRTRYPLGVDCYGGRHYSVVADRLHEARYLGVMPPAGKVPRPSELPPHTIKRSGEGGVIGRLEEEAIAHCK